MQDKSTAAGALVPDALSRKPRTTQDIQELLCIHHDEEGEPLMEVKIPTKAGWHCDKRVLFALYSKLTEGS